MIFNSTTRRYLVEVESFKKLINEKEDYKEIKDMVTTYEKKGIQQGIQKGIQQGISLGIQQGIPLGAQRLILHQLKKFGPISEEIENKIKSINDLNKLDKRGIALLDVRSLEEFVAELDKIN